MTDMKRPNSTRLKSIAKRYGLRLVILFGSQVTGRTHPDSDVDIAAWAERPLSAAQRTQLWFDLSNQFQSEIDLTVLNHAEPLLLHRVATTGRLLYEDKRGTWLDFKGYAFRYYQDSQKMRDDLARYLQRELRGAPDAR
jgi:predicted nucleotidyltransferase